jgi:carbonic anhydrase
VSIVNALGRELGEKARMRMLLEQNMLLQLMRPRTHPSVATRIARGKLELHGWV